MSETLTPASPEAWDLAALKGKETAELNVYLPDGYKLVEDRTPWARLAAGWLRICVSAGRKADEAMKFVNAELEKRGVDIDTAAFFLSDVLLPVYNNVKRTETAAAATPDPPQPYHQLNGTITVNGGAYRLRYELLNHLAPFGCFVLPTEGQSGDDAVREAFRYDNTPADSDEDGEEEGRSVLRCSFLVPSVAAAAVAASFSGTGPSSLWSVSFHLTFAGFEYNMLATHHLRTDQLRTSVPLRAADHGRIFESDGATPGPTAPSSTTAPPALLKAMSLEELSTGYQVAHIASKEKHKTLAKERDNRLYLSPTLHTMFNGLSHLRVPRVWLSVVETNFPRGVDGRTPVRVRIQFGLASLLKAFCWLPGVNLNEAAGYVEGDVFVEDVEVFVGFVALKHDEVREKWAAEHRRGDLRANKEVPLFEDLLGLPGRGKRAKTVPAAGAGASARAPQ